MTTLRDELTLLIQSGECKGGFRSSLDRLFSSDRHAKWVCPAGTSQFNGPFGREQSIEFPICERAMLGYALGASLTGHRIVCELPFLSFALNGWDMLCVASSLYQQPLGQRGRMLVIAPLGRGQHLGVQHEWSELGAIASLPFDRVLVATSVEHAVACAHLWWFNGDRWLLLLPLTIPLEEGTLNSDTIGRPKASILALGAAVRRARRVAAELESQGMLVDACPVNDLRDPTDGLSLGRSPVWILDDPSLDGSIRHLPQISNIPPSEPLWRQLPSRLADDELASLMLVR